MQPLPRNLLVGAVRIEPATALAPMAGLTDTVFRQLIRAQGGCGLVMTEFVSSHGVVHAARAARPGRMDSYLAFAEAERPIAVQLFGADPEVMAEAARVCEGRGFDLVDINFGCPVKKVVRSNGGSGLLRDLPRVEQILRKVRAAIRIPLTVKYRAGWSERELVHVELARLAEDCGVDALTLHPRTRLQGYAGKADWRRIGEVKQAVRIPVIGNGDIASPEDAVRMVAETGCDAVMVGRAAASNPWIFRQIAEYGTTGDFFRPSELDRYRMMQTYYGLLAARAEPNAIGKMKQFATLFTHGIRNGSRLRTAIHRSPTIEEILAAVDRFFAALAEPVPAGKPPVD